MPKKVTEPAQIKQIIDSGLTAEQESVLKNRIYRFKELLGDEAEQHQLDRLVYSKVDYWDLDKLLKNGCEPELALDILL